MGQHFEMRGTWFSGGVVGFMAGFDDLKGLSQPKGLSDSMYGHR